MQLGYLLDVVGKPLPLVPVLLNASGLNAHTAIIAQSGSGKSFMLGRLLEELLCKTKARVLILDPNSDFLHFFDVNNDAWTSSETKEWFDHADTQAAFSDLWNRMRFLIYTGANVGTFGVGAPNVEIKPPSIAWAELDMFSKARQLGLNLRDHPYEMNALVKAERTLEKQCKKENQQPTLKGFLGYAWSLWQKVGGLSGTPPKDFPDPSIYGDDLRSEIPADKALALYARTMELSETRIWDNTDSPDSIHRRLTAFARGEAPNRVTVIDLASLATETEQLAISAATIDAVWRGARASWSHAFTKSAEEDERCPTFIVIDEAHNILPDNPTGELAKHVVDKLVRVAAEGRKYALSLILITQRPSRVNASVLSQCDNLCLLKMSSYRDIELIEQTFGVVPRGWAERAMQFRVGDALLCGGFIDKPVYAHIAPRRTQQGGRNVRKDYWTSPV